MIATIRNPWLRRGILIAALVVYTPFAVLAAVLGVLWDCWRELRQDVPAAWRGPKPYATGGRVKAPVKPPIAGEFCSDYVMSREAFDAMVRGTRR